MDFKLYSPFKAATLCYVMIRAEGRCLSKQEVDGKDRCRCNTKKWDLAQKMCVLYSLPLVVRQGDPLRRHFEMDHCGVR